MSTDLQAPGAHFGNPLAEQRALVAGDAIVELPDRAVVTITGPDRLSWLDSLTSQSVARLQPGGSAETLLLDPTGRLEHAMRVVDDGEVAWLLVDGAEGAPLAAWLDRMRFMLRVEIADRSADFLTVGAFDGAALESLAERVAAPHGVPLIWVDPWREVAVGGHQYSLVSEHPAAGWTYREALVARDADLSDLAHAGTLALEALRVAAWRPRLATEGDERSIPHELDWLRSAVHLAKGCYRGQETVAKVHNLGHPPRRLVMLHLDGSESPVPPAAGSAVLLDGAEVGRVTSPALHFELGPIALAVVKRSVSPDAALVVDGDVPVAAAQEVIVPTDAGAEANVPRLPKLGRVTRPAS